MAAWHRDPGNQARVVELYRSGLSTARIGEMFGVSANSARRALVIADEPARNRGRQQSIPDGLARKIADAYAGGHSAAALARQFGVSTRTILRAVVRGGARVRVRPAGLLAGLTDEARRQYIKVRRELGAEAARAEFGIGG